MAGNTKKKRKRGRPSKAQRLEDFSILSWRSQLFLMISDELESIKKRELNILKDGEEGYERIGGAGGSSDKVGRLKLSLEYSNSLIDGAIKAISSTKQEADLEEKLKDAEADKKKLQAALKRLEEE